MDTEFSHASSSVLSPEDISRLGDKFYFDELRETLERDHKGEYLVIDVTNKKYVVDADKLRAIEKAENEFGKQLFYIIQIGNLQRPFTNFKKHIYAWQF